MILCDHFALFGTWISCCIKIFSVYFHPTNTKNHNHHKSHITYLHYLYYHSIPIVQALGLPTYLVNVATIFSQGASGPQGPRRSFSCVALRKFRKDCNKILHASKWGHLCGTIGRSPWSLRSNPINQMQLIIWSIDRCVYWALSPSSPWCSC